MMLISVWRMAAILFMWVPYFKPITVKTLVCLSS